MLWRLLAKLSISFRSNFPSEKGLALSITANEINVYA